MSDGETYAAFIEGELKAEHDRRTALDARAAGVATASSAFIALAGALTVLVTGSDHSFSGTGARGVVLSLVAFLLAAVIALVANGSRKYEVAAVKTVQEMLAGHWDDSEVSARHAVATLNAKSIRSLRKGNNRKAGQLVVGHVFQLTATAGLIATLAWELRSFISWT